MSKTTGMGDAFYVGGYDIGGDTNSLSKISGSVAPIDVTDITQSAHSRLGGLRDGGIDFTAYHDTAAGAAHAVLSPLPTADVICTYFRGTAIGNPAASMNAKLIDYDPTRGTDGSLTFAVSSVADAYGLEWGVQLTAGRRVDGSATAASGSASYDTGASASFGAQMYVHLFAFSGTSVTIKVQDSADNSSFADISGSSLTTAALTGANVNTAVRVTIPNTTTVRRYIAVATVGTFSNADFAVHVTKNTVSGIVF